MVNKSMIFWTCQNVPKRPRAPKHIFGDWNMKNLVPYFEQFEKYIKDAPNKSVQNGSYTSPNELARFRNEAKPNWVEIQKHCKNAVII